MTKAGAASSLPAHLFPNDKETLERMTSEAAFSRLQAGGTPQRHRSRIGVGTRRRGALDQPARSDRWFGRRMGLRHSAGKAHGAGVLGADPPAAHSMSARWPVADRASGGRVADVAEPWSFDVEEGLAIGRRMAPVFVKRARRDGRIRLVDHPATHESQYR